MPDTPHNVLFKLFASKTKQKTAAFAKIEDVAIHRQLPTLERHIINLGTMVLQEGAMALEVTQKDFELLNSLIGDTMLRNLPVEKRLEGLSTSERLRGLSTMERLKDISSEELRKALEEREQKGID